MAPSTAVCKDHESMQWPLHRLSYDELQPIELQAIDKLFSPSSDAADAPLFMKWCLQHKCRRQTFQKRLLVVSSFRLWTLKPHRMAPLTKSLVVAKEFQWLHLQSLHVIQHAKSSGMMSIELVFLHGQTLHVDAGVHSETLVRLLQRLLHSLRFAFRQRQVPSVLLPTHCHWQEFFATDPKDSKQSEANAITMAYRAFCDDLGIEYRPSVMERLRECAQSAFACVDFHYCLRFPSLNGNNSPFSSADTSSSAAATATTAVASVHGANSTISRLWTSAMATFGSASAAAAAEAAIVRVKEVQALAQTLENCDWFENILVYDYVLEDTGMVALFHSLLSPTSAIKGFSLLNVNLSVRALLALEMVLQTLATNTKWKPLKRLDLSFNRLTSVAMVDTLGRIMKLLPHGLEVLQLERCGLVPESSAELLSVIKLNPAFASTLRDLNLSSNSLGKEGTEMLARWIIGAFALRRLDLSKTSLDMTVFFTALRQNSVLFESSLTSLDLSYNRMTTPASIDLGQIVGKSQSLSVLILRGMRQHRLWHQSALLLHNQRFRHHHKHFALVKSSKSPPRVVFAARGLHSKHLRNILTPFFQNTTRRQPCDLDLSENDLSGTKAMVLAEVFERFPHTSRATLRLDHTAMRDSSSVLVLRALSACRTLHSLSLEGNGFIKRPSKKSQDPEAAVQPLSSVEQGAGQALFQLLGGRQSPTTSTSSSSRFERPPPIRVLSLSSSAPFVFGPHVLETAIRALAFNSWLQVLDLSGNASGDAVAMALGSVLPSNKSLQVLFWDRNHTSVVGFQAFYDGLVQNQTLVMVQMPIYDTRRILEDQKDPPREKLFSVLGKIFKLVERNQTLAQQNTRAKKTNDHQTMEVAVDKQAPPNPTDEDPTAGNQQEQVKEATVETKKKQPAGPEETPVLTEADQYWSQRYEDKTNARYASLSLSQSWSSSLRGSVAIDLNAST